MKIGFFTECYHDTNNGVVTSMDTFRRSLKERGHQVYVIAPNNGHEDNDPDVIRLPSLRVHHDYPPAITLLAHSQIRRIKGLGLDVIHCQHLGILGRLGLKIGRQLGIPVIYTYHTLLTEYVHYFYWFPIPGKWKVKIAVWLSRNFCNKVDQVVTPSQPMKDILLPYGVTQPIEVIPTGINIADFAHPYSREELKSAWNIPEDRKILLYVSRLAKEKNLDFLFEAVRILRQKRNDFHLLMVGGGPELGYFQKRVKDLGLQDCVTFTGEQKKPGVNRFFGAGYTFTFPSPSETQGIVATESMAAGVPAVAINRMGPSDIIRNGVDGFLTSLNPPEFSGRIEQLLDDETLRKKMGDQARRSAERFSIETCTDKMEKLYETTISRHRS